MSLFKKPILVKEQAAQMHGLFFQEEKKHLAY